MIFINPLQAEAGAEEQAEVDEQAEAEVSKLKLDNVQFFSWTDNVTADDMGGELQPADIDAIYCRGGKHCPIVANLISF
jgi:hypothetical protein